MVQFGLFSHHIFVGLVDDEQADDFTLAHWLKPHAEFVEERTIPLPFKVGFSLPGDKEFGSFGPARIIDLANGAE